VVVYGIRCLRSCDKVYYEFVSYFFLITIVDLEFYRDLDTILLSGSIPSALAKLTALLKLLRFFYLFYRHGLKEK
jgi:hypothetical protein